MQGAGLRQAVQLVQPSCMEPARLHRLLLRWLGLREQLQEVRLLRKELLGAGWQVQVQQVQPAQLDQQMQLVQMAHLSQLQLHLDGK